MGDWKFFNNKILVILASLSPEEREDFNCDLKSLDWNEYVVDYYKGLSIYADQQDEIEQHHGLSQILIKNKNLYDDFKESYGSKENIRARSFINMHEVLNERRFKDYLKAVLDDKTHRNGILLT